VNELKTSIKELRQFSSEILHARVKEIENKEHTPNDILSIIIENSSKNLCVSSFFFIIKNRL
jgi:hypothetical protein